MAQTHTCPICSAVGLRHVPRYPRYVCVGCERRATDAAGRLVFFHNTSLGGGIAGVYADTSEPYTSRDCTIDGQACRASEHRFGGIVIQVVGER